MASIDVGRLEFTTLADIAYLSKTVLVQIWLPLDDLLEYYDREYISKYHMGTYRESQTVTEKAKSLFLAK